MAFRMRLRIAAIVAVGVFACVVALVLVATRPRPLRWSTDRPHVVLVIGCTIRADQTTLHTPGLDTTPFLAELASRGARFTDVIAA
ncbi:MAG: hypothetical protein JRI25_19885, partial [Deltaproteobacteria bacterium]|nr:hypothetical protein [Deltaproteobacteria bacterium]